MIWPMTRLFLEMRSCHGWTDVLRRCEKDYWDLSINIVPIRYDVWIN